MIKDLFKSLYVDLLNEENFNNNIKCVICGKTKNETKGDFYYNEDKNNINYYHISCSKKKYKIIDNNSIEYIKFKIYDNCKNKIEGKALKNYNDLIKNKIKSFFKNCENNFQNLNTYTNNILNYVTSYFYKNNPLKIDNEIILKQIKSLKTELFRIFYRQKEKCKLIKKEMEMFKNNSNDKKKQNEWIKNWKKKINQYYIDNKNNINKWIILNSIFESKNNFFLKYIKKEKKKKKVIVNLYEIRSYKDSTKLKLLPPRELEEKNKFENYFPLKNKDKGLMIYKNKKKEIIIYMNDSDTLKFSGLYDYDDKSQTLIVYREENNIKKVAIYKNNNKENKYLNLKIFSNININGYFNSESKLNKIKLVPCSYGYENQAILLFIDKEIYMVIIKRNSAIGKTINLENVFKFDNFDNFQFIVHSDFLLILKYNEEIIYGKEKFFL